DDDHRRRGPKLELLQRGLRVAFVFRDLALRRFAEESLITLPRFDQTTGLRLRGPEVQQDRRPLRELERSKKRLVRFLPALFLGRRDAALVFAPRQRELARRRRILGARDTREPEEGQSHDQRRRRSAELQNGTSSISGTLSPVCLLFDFFRARAGRCFS